MDYEEYCKLHLRFESINLPEADPETLPIYKMDLFMAITKYFQPLTTVTKIVTGFLDPFMSTKVH